MFFPCHSERSEESTSIFTARPACACPVGFFAALRTTIAILVIGLGATLHAHDPYESFTTVVVHPDRMVLTMGMAQSTALRLIDPQVKIPSLTPENIPTHRPRLEREAALLFILTSIRTQLAARKVEVELTDENDIIFTVTYPRPVAGRLLVHAAYLKKLGDGYGGIVNIDDDTNRSLGWDQLLWERPNFEVAIPPIAPQKRK